MTNDFPFPQADDFDKVYKLIKIPDEDLLSDFEYISNFLDGITSRQVSYYISAAMYLGLINRDKRFTDIGNRIRSLTTSMQIVELIKILLSNNIFLSTYVYQSVMGTPLLEEHIIDLIKVEYPDYSEEIYKRRCQTVRSWTDWIFTHII